ncbi:hypothetical protein CPB84DRAFT_857130 [Gymnopilus junonius]|uniref:Uncharacterized protein n=1 Tax=Gymnopilus junonius TaxID=109634 RepID=A0A9P5TN03_GYMJU|nr:hypothetical protein CPB84DRAFT_857130 [Gymnopilus junonius]
MGARGIRSDSDSPIEEEDDDEDDDIIEMRSSSSSRTRTPKPKATPKKPPRSQSKVSTASSSSSASTSTTNSFSSASSNSNSTRDTSTSSPSGSLSPSRRSKTPSSSTSTTSTARRSTLVNSAYRPGAYRRGAPPLVRTASEHAHVTIAPIAPTILKTGTWEEGFGDEGASDDNGFGVFGAAAPVWGWNEKRNEKRGGGGAVRVDLELRDARRGIIILMCPRGAIMLVLGAMERLLNWCMCRRLGAIIPWALESPSWSMMNILPEGTDTSQEKIMKRWK